MDINQASQTLAKFRSKYPGYDDMDDSTLATKLAAKHSEYTDLAAAFSKPAGDFWKPEAQGTEGGMDTADAAQLARTRAQGTITDREQGRSFQRISQNEDGSAEYGNVYAQGGGQAMSPEEKKAVVAAEMSRTVGVNSGAQDTRDPNGARAAAARLRGELAQSQNGIQNFTGAMGDTMANMGTAMEGLVAPEAAAAQRANTQDAYVSDPDSKMGLAGRVAGMTLPMIPAALAGPGAGALANGFAETMPFQMAAQGAGEARIDAAQRRNEGQKVSGGAEAVNAILQGGLNYAGSKISLGSMNNNAANPFLRYGTAISTGAIENAAQSGASGVITAATMNDPNAIQGMTLQDLIAGGVMGGAGAGFHQLGHGFTPEHAQPKPVAEVKQDAAPKPADVTPAAVRPGGVARTRVGSPAWETFMQGDDPVAWKVWASEMGTGPQQARDSLRSTPANEIDAARTRLLDMYKAEGSEAPKNFDKPERVYAEETPVTARPQVPNEIANAGKEKIREWAKNNGYDLTPLEGMGKRPMLGELRRQSETPQNVNFDRARESVRNEVLPEMPKGSESWDAGRLKKWAKENGYEIDNRRIIDKSDRRPDEKHSDQIRRQIKEQRGEGGDLLQRHERAVESPKSEAVAPKDSLAAKIDGALAESDARMAADKTAKPADATPTAAKTTTAKTAKGLDKVPQGARKWSYTKLARWAKDAGYQVGKLQNLNALRKGITKQRSNSMIDLPEVPKASRTWNNRRLKHWAEQSGYDVAKTANRYEVKKAIVDQRKAAKKAARDAERRPSLIDESTRNSLRKELETEKALRRTDELTGAPNKIAYEEDAKRIFDDADAKGEHVGIVETDIGGLKVMNTVYGHSGGDEMLKMAHQAMRDELRVPPQKDRPGDYLGSKAYRIGGDEFPAILRGVKTKSDVKVAMERVNVKFDKMIAEKFPELPPEARPFIAYNGEIRTPKDKRDIHAIRKIADAGVEVHKTEMKKTRKVPEGRTDLLNYIEAHKTKIAKVNNAVTAAVASATTGPALKAAMNKPKGWVPKWASDFITPISSRMRDLSPKLYDRLMRMEFNTGTMRERIKRDLHDPAGEMTKALGGKGSETYNDFHLAVINHEFDKAKGLLPENQHANFEKFIQSYAELHGHMKENGVNIGTLENYWPRFIKDHKAFDAIYGDGKGKFEDAWDLARQQRGGKPLSKEEKTEIANDVSQGYGPIKPGSQGMPNSRERSIEAVSKEQLIHYVDPFESAFRYVDGAAYAGERAKFLGRSEDLSKLPESVGKIVEEEVKAGNLNKEQQQEALDLMHARFTADFLTPSRATRRIKEIMYLTSLGNFRSAISQITDSAVSAATYGIANTLKGIKARFGPADRKIIMEEIGLHEHGAEFKDTTQISKVLDKALTITQFKRIDRMGKEIHINASDAFFKDAAKNPNGPAFKRFERDYKPVLGSQFDATVADLREGKKTENTRYLAFLELTKVQPVTLSQMPERYLKMKDGRVFYALKTFTITALDNLRRTTFRKLTTPGQRREGLQNLAAYVVLVGAAGFGKDLIQDLIRGKAPAADQIPDRSVAAMLTMIGLNRYTVDKTWQKPSEGAANFLMPPMSWIDSTVNDVRTLGKDGKGNWAGVKTVQQLPIVGDLLYYWTPIGKGQKLTADAAKEDYNKKLGQLRQQAASEVASGDDASAEALLSIYNERIKAAPAGVIKQKPPETVSSVKAKLFKTSQKAAKKDVTVPR